MKRRKKNKARCETCQYWRPNEDLQGFGECKNKNVINNLQNTPITYKDFGCAFYRKRLERKVGSVKYWKAKADREWSRAVAKRAGYKCEWCGQSDGKLEAHHIISRRYIATRYDLDNGIYLCFTCHMKAHQNPQEFREFVEKKYGKKRLRELKGKAKQKGKIDYEEVYKKLKEVNDGDSEK